LIEPLLYEETMNFKLKNESNKASRAKSIEIERKFYEKGPIKEEDTEESRDTAYIKHIKKNLREKLQKEMRERGIDIEDIEISNDGNDIDFK
jgi:hypothetical protein